MPRQKKRVWAFRQNGGAVLTAAKRKKIQVADHGQLSELPEPESQPISEPTSSDSDSEQQLQIETEVEISDAEDDVLELAQPAEGWKEAGRTVAGRSKTNVGKTPQSRWYYKQKSKKQYQEEVILEKKYGNISRFFTDKSVLHRNPQRLRVHHSFKFLNHRFQVLQTRIQRLQVYHLNFHYLQHGILLFVR